MTTPHNPNILPADLPVPQDDGGAGHLAGMTLPSLRLATTDGAMVDLSVLKGRTVVYIYPRTGVPGQALPEGWARYASIAVNVALCLRSSKTTLSYVSRPVCQV